MKYLLLLLLLLPLSADAGREVPTGATDDTISSTDGRTNVTGRGTGTTFVVAGWFNVLGSASQGDFDNLYSESMPGDQQLNIFLRINGNINFFYRPGGFGNPSCSITDTGVYDDGKWHWYTFIGSADNAYTAYVDGIQTAATCTTSLTTSNTLSGIILNAASGQSLVVGAKFGRTMNWRQSLPIQVVKAAMYGFVLVKPNVFWPMLGIGTTEVDWSGNGLTGTVAGGMPGSSNPPIGRLF